MSEQLPAIQPLITQEEIAVPRLRISRLRHQPRAKVLVWVSAVIWGLLLVPSIILIAIGAMMGDGGGNGWTLYVGCISATSMHAVILVSLALSVRFYRKQRYSLAFAISLAPLLNLGGLFIWLRVY
jgi:hypothetical protein